ncbi:hypothetical protein LOTGIDRAFT_174547 [Lottia gigantea]|uniref:Endonuclease/exonuclease/phosphatase domain-containing protein n=1 Tax=Lottia gigantea TaxID=225164 RepID=V4ATS7_LOTGI|nr:hypothetical protein LOTGIDRAFT_174547 [Lottia gigantea]ESO97161.1 hypothetical protein LOTGIDRAFT_174547 [Lottia gigantea]
MGDDIAAWRINIGMYVHKSRKSILKRDVLHCNLMMSVLMILNVLIVLSGDVESNPGPNTRQGHLSKTGELIPPPSDGSKGKETDITNLIQRLISEMSDLRQEQANSNLIKPEQNHDNLSVVFWNIEGLQSKLNEHYYDITDVINGYDIIGFTETFQKAGESFKDLFPNFIQYECARICETDKAFGGVALFLKKWLVDITEKVDTCIECEETIWLKLSLKKLGRKHNLFVGLVYVPPEGSIFYSNKPANCNIQHIEVVIRDIRLKFPSDEMLLIGDFNARTGIEKDFIHDQSIYNPYMYTFQEQYGNESSKYQQLRENKDKFVNTFGNRLLKFCCEYDFAIIKGRVPPFEQGNNKTQ